MSNSNPGTNDGVLIDEAYARKILERMGGAEQVRLELHEFRKLVSKLWDERATLISEHPNQWVALSQNGVVSVADSVNAVLADVDAQGIRRRKVIIEYLDTDPPVLTL